MSNPAGASRTCDSQEPRRWGTTAVLNIRPVGAPARSVVMESVDRWPMAIVIFRRTRGYARVPVSASRRDRRRVASSWGGHARALRLRSQVLGRTSSWGIRWRQLDGAFVRTNGLTPCGEAAPGARTPPSTQSTPAALRGGPLYDSYLVDSASSHMLVSKIKPCMSKYKQLYGETANGSLNQLSFI